MSVKVIDSIGYGSTTKAVFYTDKPDGKKFSVPPDIFALSNAIWAWWGDANSDPADMADDIQNVPALSAGVETSARLALGSSIDPYLLLNKDKDGNEDLEWVSDAEINDWLELNDSFNNSYANIYNMLGYGWGASQLILSKDRTKINRIKASDVYQARLQRRDLVTQNINNMYLCSDWNFAPAGYDPLYIKQIPVLQEGYEFDQLQKTKSGFEFCMLHRLLKNGQVYYPQPLWKSAQAWVDITRSVPQFKQFMQTNQMTIKYVVIIADTYWKRLYKDWETMLDADKLKAINQKYDEIDKYLSGAANAGKSIIAGKYMDPYQKVMVNDIEITVLDDKMKDGQYLPDSAAGDKQILFSMFSNPAIFGSNLLGDGASGGAGSGSDIREATLVLLMLLHPERINNLKLYNLVKKYNGWSDKLEKQRTVFATTNLNTNTNNSKIITPRLVFRYSSSVLTTLDTGKSTKATTT